jgi:hypothetical protein
LPCPIRALAVALTDFIVNRGAEDVVLSIGFARNGTNYLYATVHGDRVDFNPQAPVASGK